MIASYHWGKGRHGNAVVFNDILAARKSLGRMDRGPLDPIVRVGPAVWAALLESKEITADWDHRQHVAANKDRRLDYQGWKFEYVPEWDGNGAQVTFANGGSVLIEECI